MTVKRAGLPVLRSLAASVLSLSVLAAGAAGCGSAAAPSKTGGAGTPGGAGAPGAAGTSGGAGAPGTAGASGGGGTSSGGTPGGAGAPGGGGVPGTAGMTGAGGGGTPGTAGAPADAGATDGPSGAGGAAGGGANTDGGFVMTTSSLKMVDGGLVFPAASSAPSNQSPALAWSGAPAGTLSFALTMYDASAQNTHFILFDIAPTETMLPANLPRGAMPAMPAGASWKSAFGGTPGYEGPGGGTVNNYQLVIWALKVAKLDIGNMTLNQIHMTLLPQQSLGTATILARGTRNGL
jgi:phosphatidylethanolamine-binding protein (PEBP) family uncharacterized protein